MLLFLAFSTSPHPQCPCLQFSLHSCFNPQLLVPSKALICLLSGLLLSSGICSHTLLPRLPPPPPHSTSTITCAAHITVVAPALVRACTFAPSCANTRTVSVRPFTAAFIMAVVPSSCAAVTSALSSASASTVSVCPFIAADMTAVQPSLVCARGSAFSCTSARTCENEHTQACHSLHSQIQR